MSANHIDPADLQAIKSHDSLLAFCERELSPLRRRGRIHVCRCPFGVHTSTDHLELAERDGAGVAHCHACGGGGSVLDVAAAIMGIDARKQLAEAARYVAAVTGYNLRDTSTDTPHKRRVGNYATARIRQAAETLAQKMTLSPAVPVVEYLPAEDEVVAFEAIDYARYHENLMARHAAMLKLPLRSLMWHTYLDADISMRGHLGLAPDGRLLYVYTTRDRQGRLRVSAVKLRHGGGQHEQMLWIWGGAWQMHTKDGKPCNFIPMERKGQPIKFLFSALASNCPLFGTDELSGHDIALLTESESDKLSLDYMADYLREAYQTGIEEEEEYMPEAEIPVAMAYPSANGFRAHHAALFKGKSVYIIADADKAGLDGAGKTAQLLYEAGVRGVCQWTPPAPHKDIRAFINAAASPIDAYTHIMLNSTKIL